MSWMNKIVRFIVTMLLRRLFKICSLKPNSFKILIKNLIWVSLSRVIIPVILRILASQNRFKSLYDEIFNIRLC
jgi:hypothetical protein